MEPSKGSRPNSPQSDDSSSESNLSSSSFNRNIDLANRSKDVIEAEPLCDNILDMALVRRGLENESDIIAATKTNLSSQIDLIESTDKKTGVLPKPVGTLCKSFSVIFQIWSLRKFFLKINDN